MPDIWEVARFAGDGYDRAEFVRKAGWRPISGWGADGYDLGSWPYVMVFFRERGGRFELAVNVEGDTDVTSYETGQEREAATDEVAFFYWKAEGAEWVDGIAAAADLPPELRGPYSSKRFQVQGSHR